MVRVCVWGRVVEIGAQRHLLLLVGGLGLGSVKRGQGVEHERVDCRSVRSGLGLRLGFGLGWG